MPILRLASKSAFRRNREIVSRAADLLDPDRPMTLRHLFYLLISDGLIENSDKEHQNLSRIAVDARMDGRLPFEGIVDGLRESIKPSSWSGLADFADTVREAYRKDLWQRQGDYIEFWFEKDAIVGVVEDIAGKYDVKLRPLRGQSSLSFIYQAAKELSQIHKPMFLYYLGDHDPSGYAIEQSARSRLNELLRRLDVPLSLQWKRISFLPEDFEVFRIAPLKAKRRDRNYEKFVRTFGNDHAAELDAIPPDDLRGLVETTVLSHVDMRAWRKLQRVEEMERESFNNAMKSFGKPA